MARRRRSALVRFLGRTRRRAWQALQKVDPSRFALHPAPPTARIAMVCVYRGRHAGNVRALLDLLPDGATTRLWSLDGTVPQDLAPNTIGVGAGVRFVLLNRLIAEVPADERRDGLVVADDDVRVVAGDLNRLVGTGMAAQLDLYQPAHGARSFAGYPFVRRQRFTLLRQTEFVEQGPLVVLSRRGQQHLLPLPEDLGMGWGAEARWWVTARRHGLRLGIVDAVAVQHLAPAGGEYDRAEQWRFLEAELEKIGVRDVQALQTVWARLGALQALASRRSRARLPVNVLPVETALLLPKLPAQEQVRPVGALGHSWAGVANAGGDVLVHTSALPAPADEIASVLLAGRGHGGLDGRGFHLSVYDVRAAVGGATALIPVGDRDAAQVASGVVVRRRWRRRAIDRTIGARVLVATREPGPPAVLRDALGPEAGRAVLLAGHDQRRRVAFLTVEDDPPRIVKVGRVEQGVDRAASEQRMLGIIHDLGLGRPLPHPLGHGRTGTLVWSVESRLAGRPLATCWSDPEVELFSPGSVLDGLVQWLGALGAATAECADNRLRCPPLRDRYEAVSSLVEDLRDVPSVLVHGDLASGSNVLVDGRRFVLIDWETAGRGLPMLDVLPFLCAALAAGTGGPGATAERVVRLCQGRTAASDRLFSLITEYCARVGVPLSQAGPLALLAVAYQASMPLVRDELLVAAGDQPDTFISPWTEIADRWLTEPGLGADWSALRQGR